MTRRATGERKRVSRFIKPVVVTKRMELIITKAAACFTPIFPEGISLFSVLGFLASIFLSASRLKLIAALRAKIMQRMTRTSSFRLLSFSVLVTARVNPIRAKGIAKTV